MYRSGTPSPQTVLSYEFNLYIQIYPKLLYRGGIQNARIIEEERGRKGQDPTVAKQWDDQTPTEQKFEDMYAIADKLKICMMGTARPGLGVRFFNL